MSSDSLHILYDQSDVLPAVQTALTARQVPHDAWRMGAGFVDLSGEPPPGVFLNLVTATSDEAATLTTHLVTWLEHHQRRVINGTPALALQRSKIAQYLALTQSGILSPHTVAVVGGLAALRGAVRNLECPFIAKWNHPQPGHTAQQFATYEHFDEYLRSDAYAAGPDQITLLQEYVEPRSAHVTRATLVNGTFVCATERAMAASDRTVRDVGSEVPPALIGDYQRFAREQRIDIIHFDYLTGSRGQIMTISVTCGIDPVVPLVPELQPAYYDAIAACVQDAGQPLPEESV